MNNNIIFGIDLGTSNSSICYYNNSTNKIIKIYDTLTNSYCIPSVISIVDNNLIFGSSCKNTSNNNITISNIKRLIGYDYDELDDVYKSIGYITKNIDNNKIIICDKFSPEDILCLFLKYLKSIILIELNKLFNDNFNNIINVIITVPAYFTIKQKNIINECIINSGLNLIKLLSEPVSACIGYCYDNVNNNIIKDDTNIMIFDLGGGTLDMSIVNYDDGIYQVKNTYGNNKFGGSDLTYYMIQYLECKYNDVVFNDNDIFNKVDDMKIKLNNGVLSASLLLDNYNNLDIFLNIDEFNDIVEIWLEKLNDDLLIIDNKENINLVIMVGGSCRIKQVKNKLNDFFISNNNKTKIIFDDNIIDIVVAYGAAYQGYLINCKNDVLLLDICPYSIGIEMDDGTMEKIIHKNSVIPSTVIKSFTTTEDEQSEVDIKIYQGESNFVKNNLLIGNFKLTNITKKKKGMVVINISININNNGYIVVSAYDKNKGIVNEIQIKLDDVNISFDNINNNFDPTEENKIIKLLSSYSNLLIILNKLTYNLIHNCSNISTNKNIIIDDLFLKFTKIKYLLNNDIITNILNVNKFNVLYNSFNYNLNNYLNDNNTEYSDKNILFDNIIYNIDNFIKYIDDKYNPLISNYFLDDSIEDTINYV